MADPVVVASTRLDAVNVMLATIGIAPLNSLEGTLTADVSLAISVLDRTSREVQSKGWHFNTEKDYPLTPNTSSEINLGANTLRVDLKRAEYSDYDVVQRGSRLYDRKEHAYTFPNVTEFLAEVVIGLPFDEMPECARAYITIKSARTFQAQTVGSDTLDAFTKYDEFDALSTLKEFEGDTADHNIFNNYDAASVLDRNGEMASGTD